MGTNFRRTFKMLGTHKILATILMLAPSITAVAQTPDKAKLDQFFDRLAAKDKAMGSLVIAKDGQIVYRRAIGFGQMTGAEKKPLTEASRFGIASITKTYTAVMILQLAEEGKLKLTDTLDKFFPQIPNAQKITLSQILTHRSGIPNVIGEKGPQRDPNHPPSKDEMLALIVNAAPEFEPDSRSSYSNSGYFVLDLIVEKVTGKPYAEALNERITSKLGLADTYLVAPTIDVNKNEALTYWRLGNEWKPGRETHPVIFEIVSTPADMAKFIQALFDLKLISQQSLDQMKTMRDGEGMGLVTFTYAGKTFYGNTGGGDNYGSWLAFNPEDKLAIAYCSNAKVYPVAKIISGVADIYYHQPFEIPKLESVDVSTELLEKYVGTYSAPGAPGKGTISRKESTLYFQPPGTPAERAVPLEATSEDTFQIEGVVTLTFDATKGQVTVKRRNGPQRVFTKDK